MCTGACLRAAARHWTQLGLGPGAHKSPAELAPAAPVARRSPRTRLLRRRRLHVCIWHENVCSMICNFEISLNRIHAPLPETTRRPKFCKTRNIRNSIRNFRNFWSIRINTRSFRVSHSFPRSVPNPEYPGLHLESPGFLPFLPPKTEILISGKTNPQIETLLDPSRVIHKKMIDPKKSLKTS